jgi:hypothetical protein
MSKKTNCCDKRNKTRYYKKLAAEMKINIPEEIKIKYLIEYNGDTKSALRSILSKGLYKQ